MLSMQKKKALTDLGNQNFIFRVLILSSVIIHTYSNYKDVDEEKKKEKQNVYLSLVI